MCAVILCCDSPGKALWFGSGTCSQGVGRPRCSRPACTDFWPVSEGPGEHHGSFWSTRHPGLPVSALPPVNLRKRAIRALRVDRAARTWTCVPAVTTHVTPVSISTLGSIHQPHPVNSGGAEDRITESTSCPCGCVIGRNWPFSSRCSGKNMGFGARSGILTYD